MSISRPQRRDVLGAHGGRFDEIRTPPREALSSERNDEQIGGESRVASVTVGKRVYRHQPVVKAHGSLVGRKRVMFDPVPDVVEKHAQFDSDAKRLDPRLRSVVRKLPAHVQTMRNMRLCRSLRNASLRTSRVRVNAHTSASVTLSCSASFSCARLVM